MHSVVSWPQRDLTQNILEFEVFSRMLELQLHEQSVPLLMFMDMPLPSRVSQRNLLWATLHRIGLLGGYISLMKGLCTDMRMWWTGTPTHSLGVATSGVAQGCPLTGKMLLIVMDPVVRNTQEVLRAQREGMVAFVRTTLVSPSFLALPFLR